MKIFGIIVATGWGLLFVTVALLFTFTKPVSNILHPIFPYFPLIPGSLLLLTVVYAILRLYHFGMDRRGPIR
jgi:hypothetical protein